MNTNEFIKLCLDTQTYTVNPEYGFIISKRVGKLKYKHNNDYMEVHLSYKGTKKICKVHRIIWIAVNGIPPKDRYVDHIDHDKTNNGISNLRLVNAKESQLNRTTFVHISDEDEAKVIELYKTRMSKNKIAKTIQRNRMSIYYIISEYLKNGGEYYG